MSMVEIKCSGTESFINEFIKRYRGQAYQQHIPYEMLIRDELVLPVMVVCLRTLHFRVI